jgi:hypothetical protein
MFTVLTLAITEKERIGSGISVIDMASLSDKTTGDNRTSVDRGAGADNKSSAITFRPI